MTAEEELSWTLGDPRCWDLYPMFDGEANDFSLYKCPQCGCGVVDPYRHKAWHIQNKL